MALSNYDNFEMKSDLFVMSSYNLTISYYAGEELCESLACYYGKERAHYSTSGYSCIVVKDRFRISVETLKGGRYEVMINDKKDSNFHNIRIIFNVEIDPGKVIFLLENWKNRFRYLKPLNERKTRFELSCTHF